MIAHRADGVDVGRHGKIGVMPLQHAGQSAPLFVDRIVPDALQFQLDRLDSGPLALAPRPSQQRERAAAGFGLALLHAADMGEAQEVESLRSPFATRPPLAGNKSAEHDEARLVGMEIERELGEPLLQIIEEPLASPRRWSPTIKSSA